MKPQNAFTYGIDLNQNLWRYLIFAIRGQIAKFAKITFTAKITPAKLPAPGLRELVDVITASIYPRRLPTIPVYGADNVLGGR